MIKVLETTNWNFSNHTYFLTDNQEKVLGYIKAGTTNTVMFTTPLKFYKQKRTFKQIK